MALAVRALKALALERNLARAGAGAVARHSGATGPTRGRPRRSGRLGAIKQCADLVLAIYREEMYRPGQGVEGATELIVAKNRNGPTGFVDLFFYPRMAPVRGPARPGDRSVTRTGACARTPPLPGRTER